MDRRSFITTLIGGFAVAGLGGTALAQAPEAAQPVALNRDPVDDAVKLDSEALDKTDAEFSQYYYRRRRRYYRRPYGYRRRRFYGRRSRRFDWRARSR